MPSICPLQHVERWTTITTTTATALADWGTFCSLPLKRLMTFTRPTHNYSNNVTDSRLDWLATGQCCNRGNSAADDISEVSGDNLTRRCRVAAALRCLVAYVRKGFAFRVPPHATEQQQQRQEYRQQLLQSTFVTKWGSSNNNTNNTNNKDDGSNSCVCWPPFCMLLN